ncbi:Gfo/Idh/MocA family protein [Amycolatopsis sp. YIM 10]|uniref:Gfo/Idh/MocA family protein n=1 Tax=Amycolatopsis sp. YIM 10 TaxID=2653857 RepID=UPI0012903217|nr:Gfo/Idh/MocA family oxidoreductase [Amycolatopsis sp. YIM 10]QFU87523.1 1,5-anhydro-D-fructose reductase [Amycolatopsis sp. YIM 10]
MRRLTIGVLGCAAIARRHALPALLAEPGVELVAVASRAADKAAEFAAEFGTTPVTGYQRLLDRPDVDAVYVPLPPGPRAEWIHRALAAGKHVLAEKPLTTGLADAEKLVAHARERSLVLMENFAFVRHRQLEVVRELLADGAIGELRQFTGEFGFPPLSPGDIRYQRELGGGALLDAGVYPIRAASLFLGPELRVAGGSLVTDHALGVDVGGAALLTSPDGVPAQLSFGFGRAYRCACTLWGSEGRLTLSRVYSAPPGLAPPLLLERQGTTEERALPADNQFRKIFRAFADAVAAGTDTGAEILTQAALVESVRARA